MVVLILARRNEGDIQSFGTQESSDHHPENHEARQLLRL